MRKLIFLIVCIGGFVSCANTNKKEIEKQELNKFIDNWHHAAAIADEDVFFGSLADSAVYLGTDPKERWLKQEFMDWGMKYFERETAWAFKPYNRFWEFSEDMNYAWFDELLETHMGICRGSGVLKKEENRWKIVHYNLALTLPNEQMNEFRNIVNMETL